MAKKSGAFWGLLAIGAAVGTYAYLQKKNTTIPENMDDDDDLDNFDADIEEAEDNKRSYTSLNFSDVEKKVTDAAVKFADSADKAASTLGAKLQTAAGKIEEFFDDRKPADDEAEAEEAKEEEETDELTKELEEELEAELEKKDEESAE